MNMLRNKELSMEMKIFTLKTRSGLHCGIGQGLSDIDLPTAKESVSGYPIVPGSSLKGVLRAEFDDGSKNPVFLAGFGQKGTGGNLDFASALSFSDARLICLPVRSYFGTFAYLASPYSLGIVRDMLRQSGRKKLPALPSYPIPRKTDNYRGSVPQASKLITLAAGNSLADKILLEDLDLLVDSESSQLAEDWARVLSAMLYPNDAESGQLFMEHFAIADDNVLAFFCETALPVATHTKIGSNGVVAPGALWFEEFVPPEAIFIGAVYGEQGRGDKNKEYSATDLLNFVCSKPIDCQVGGSATTGRGLVSINFQ
jgi:CRISPR-associated protein Cmr4